MYTYTARNPIHDGPAALVGGGLTKKGTTLLLMLGMMVSLLVGRALALDGAVEFDRCLDDVGAGLEVVFPWEGKYQGLRRVSSQMWDAYPRAVVLPSSEDDIVGVLKCANRFGVRVTARGGGHGNAGQSVIHGALTINLSKMDNVTVSEDLDTVVVQTGATAGKVVHDVVIASNGTRNIARRSKAHGGHGWAHAGRGVGFFLEAVWHAL
jgi:hypothetical protein